MDIKNTAGFPDWHFVNDDKCIAWAETNGTKYEIGPAQVPWEGEKPEFPVYIDGKRIGGTGTYSLGDAIHWCEAVATGFNCDNDVFMDCVRKIIGSANLLQSIILETREQLHKDEE